MMKYRSIRLGLLATTLTAASCGDSSSHDPADAAAMHDPALSGGSMEMSTPWITPGLRQPPAVRADEAMLADDAPVIGVVADGRPRAYLVSAMRSMSSHVVNDLVGEVPVTVTYCDRTDCIRTFSAKSRGEPLTLGVGGWSNGGMELRLDERNYPQESAEVPLDDFEFERTTWGEWRERHPETEIFVGENR
jgi:hypothetical protein